MDLSSFQRKAILLIFISVLAGAILLSRKEQFKPPLPEEKTQPKPALSIPAKIDINTADIALLTKLPGIGPGLAKQIVDYRNQHGLFQTLGDLQEVPGIGPKRIERIREKVTLGEKEAALSTKINLNTASPEELATITGIGPKLARAIVDYRKENGPFGSLDELILVPRIGKKTCENLKSYLYVDVESQPEQSVTPKEFTTTSKRSHEIDTTLKCPHCGKTLWEKGKKKRVFIRCPHCLRLLDEE